MHTVKKGRDGDEKAVCAFVGAHIEPHAAFRAAARMNAAARAHRGKQHGVQDAEDRRFALDCLTYILFPS